MIDRTKFYESHVFEISDFNIMFFEKRWQICWASFKKSGWFGGFEFHGSSTGNAVYVWGHCLIWAKSISSLIPSSVIAVKFIIYLCSLITQTPLFTNLFFCSCVSGLTFNDINTHWLASLNSIDRTIP